MWSVIADSFGLSTRFSLKVSYRGVQKFIIRLTLMQLIMESKNYTPLLEVPLLCLAFFVSIHYLNQHMFLNKHQYV